MGQFWRDEEYLEGGGWWILFLIIFWGLTFILPAAYLIIKGIPKFFRNIPNFIKSNSNFFGVLFVIIAIFIIVLFGSYISVNFN